MNPLIATSQLFKSYPLGPSNVTVLKNINLTIESGELTAIMGPSGCGKSTLMHLLGLLDTPSSGQIFFKGQDVSRLAEGGRARFRNAAVGFVFQSFNLLPKISSLENVLLPTVYATQGPSLGTRTDFQKRAQDLLAELGLGHRLGHHPNQLSGGESQRVAIARALINNPPLILADEPTGNLDSKSGGEILNLLRDLNRQGRTIVVVTHDQSVAGACQRIVKMKDGMIIDG